MSFVSLYRSQVKSAESAVATARRTRDGKRKKVIGLESDVTKLEQKVRQSRSESQLRSNTRQLESRSGALDRARKSLVSAEDALSKAEAKLSEKEQRLRKEELRERESARRTEEQESRREDAHRAAREAQRDRRIGELEERLREAERRAAPPEITVLFLASSPEDEKPLRLDKETRSIQKRMRAAEYRDSIFIEWRLARQVTDLIQDLNEVRPDVLHFSGHGNRAELAFEDAGGRSTTLSNTQLKRLLDAAPHRIRLMVFNSCKSVAQAEIAVEHVDVAIGMETTIGDGEAQTFAGQFYNSLGFGLSVAQAFEQARFQIEADHGGGHEIPTLVSADGVDPETVVLVNPND